MPTYEYACKSCGEHLEVVQSFTDQPLTECPACGGALRKVFGSIGITFKGSGFYKTDSRATSSSSTKSDTKSESSKSDAAGSKSESKSDGTGSGSGSKGDSAKSSGDGGSKSTAGTGTSSAAAS